tara:strand:+ start:1146 stop:1598 length:453 start_codon:yes stop_codon:yes gene_type:complete
MTAIDLLVPVLAVVIIVGGLVVQRTWERRRAAALAAARKIQKPNQAEATRIVWNDVYGCTDEPPVVHFADGETAFSSLRGNAVAGEANPEEIALAWPAGATWSSSAFAHELNHVRLLRSGGAWQEAHEDPSWAPGGLVDRAVLALRVRGL